jgi:hypothetical protein
MPRYYQPTRPVVRANANNLAFWGTLLIGRPVREARGPWCMHALVLEAGVRPVRQHLDPAEVRGSSAVCRSKQRYMGD